MFNLFNDSINDFVKSHSMAVIATIDANGQPYTSTIFYALTKKDELHFITKSQTTKYVNLKNNHKSAMTITHPTKPIAVNMTGEATQITEPKETDEIMQLIFKLSYEQLQDYAPIIKLHKGSFSVFKFTPYDAKLTDFSQPLGKVHEKEKHF